MGECCCSNGYSCHVRRHFLWAATDAATLKAPGTLRLIVRRTRLERALRTLWPNWRHHAFVTNRDDLDTETADAHHRAHARVELAIRDVNDTGLAHCPSRKFVANADHLACAALAHNLARWTARLAHAQNPRALTVAATTRNRHLTVAGRVVNHRRQHILPMPTNWPWAHTFTRALQQLRNLPMLI